MPNLKNPLLKFSSILASVVKEAAGYNGCSRDQNQMKKLRETVYECLV